MNNRHGIPAWVAVIIIGPLLALTLIFAYFAARGMVRVNVTNTTTITHAAVVERVRDVAKIISAEYHVRDVIHYENTWYGSKKMSLVVATGKILAGINLSDRAKVEIAESSKTIRIRLPRASTLSTEITDLTTYDEQRGWWNPFTKEDRDQIFREARHKFLETAKELKVRERAEASAKRLLESMFSRDGYTAEVVFE